MDLRSNTHFESTADRSTLVQVPEEGNGLESLSETHFVRKDAVDPFVVEGDQPVETFQLIGTHRAADNALGLGSEVSHGVVFGTERFVIFHRVALRVYQTNDIYSAVRPCLFL